MNDRTEDARKLLEKYPGFEFVPLKLEDAFDPNWWKSVNGASTEAIEANFNDGGIFC
jgi:cytoplasmic tRNA 2-thiolation protein 2